MVGQGRSLGAEVLVFVCSLLWIGWNVDAVPLASGFTDPVRKVRPQDEALYSSISIGMAERGDWLTPRFMGRLAFVKPWLAFLPAAASVKLFGVARWSLRLWPILCGAALLTLFYRWGGWSGVLLLAANPLFFLLARRNMTDVPVLTAVAFAIYLWHRHPPSAGLALGLGVLTKSVAGVIPALLQWSPRVLFTAAAIIAPWHLYQLAVNGEWYWKEHILDEHLQWGLRTPENAAADPHWAFYAFRAWEIDPILAVLAPLVVVYAWWRGKRVEAAWLTLSIAVLFVFGYRNATYLLPVFAITALIAGQRIHPVLAALVVAGRLYTGQIAHASPPPVPMGPALVAYCEERRGNGLIVDGMDDELVATTMPLARVQYLLPGDARTMASTNIDFPRRGIVAPEFEDRPEPREAVLLVSNTADVQRIVAAAPHRDFLLKPERMEGLRLTQHDLTAAAGGFVLLRSRVSARAASASRHCFY